MPEASDRRCPQCDSGVLVRATTRSGREALAVILGGEIRRCHFCDARFICFRQFSMQSQAKVADNASLAIVWLALFSGIVTCLVIALWTLRRFHRWPF